MATIDVLDPAGKKAGSRELPDAIFASEVNVPLMHQVVVAGLASVRAGTHSTKTRGDVSGGGKKPWRQKGTGRARQGSIRSPQWVGGGVAHGPQPHGHELRVNKKMKKGALRSALTDALRSGKLAVIEAPSFDAPKTSEAVAALAAFGVEGRALVVLKAEDHAVWKSLRNLQHVHICEARELNAYDVLVSDWVIFTEDTLPTAEASKPEGEEPATESESSKDESNA